ncbi:MAG TPA: 3-methyladenine DNA glycosylase [Actinomycetales bacterium]|nr:3-methyladenine DNA glycosylase [Actinomycetales bacterium]
MTAVHVQPGVRVLPESEWKRLEREHEHQVDAWTAGRRARAPRGERHPVDDFLWTYYSHRPSRLRRWHPGAGVVLAGAAAAPRTGWRWYRAVDGGVAMDVDGFLAARGDLVRSVRDLLAATAGRPAQLGCFGLHEWAMVYGLRPGQQRHEDWPLRLTQRETDAVVESQPVRCTHFDAFRFFTPPARGLNSVQPSRAGQVELEQPGCLHAAMDLYKLSYKLTPAAPSALVRRCFTLAREARELDMRASPYDLSTLGLSPVPVETPAGRAQYVAGQRGFSERGQVLRGELLGVCDRLLKPA